MCRGYERARLKRRMWSYTHSVDQRSTSVSGCGNPRNSGRQETRFAKQTNDRREILVPPEKSPPNPGHAESRDCLARKRNNMNSKAKSVPDFLRNASIARKTRISTAINNQAKSLLCRLGSRCTHEH